MEEGSRNQIEGQENEGEKKSSLDRTRSISFMVSSIFGVLLSLVASGLFGLLINLDFLETIKLPSLSLITWIGIGATLYCLIGFFLDRSTKKKGFIHEIFRIPIWSELRNFGDQNVAKVSYLGLIIIPIVAFFYNENINGFILSKYFIFPENLKLIYFASWSFSIALLTYSIGCPKLIRKEKGLDKAKNVNLILNSVKDSNILIEDEKKDHPKLDKESISIRTLSFLFYLIGITLTIVILFRGASIVYNV